MLAESQRLNRLVESLLSFGRLESGRYEYHFEPVELGSFAATLAEGFQSDAARQGHAVEFQWSGAALPVHADRDALRSVVWNLLDNAVKYSPERDTVWFEVQRSAEHAVLAVRDEGIGIVAEERAEIFGKFVRGAEARRRSIQGTGIGLAFANTVIAAHGGRIEVESTPGAGSTFRVWLPLNGGIDGENSCG
jgi:signal transduction histidine kinase